MRVSRDQNLSNLCCKMSICANSLWNSCNSGINIEAHSLGSQQLAGHFPMRLPIEADLDLFKTKGLEELCPGFVKHSHKSHLREHSSEHMSSISRNSPTDYYIFRSSMSQISLGQTSFHHLPCIISNVSFIIEHLSCIIYHLAPIMHHLSSIIYHSSSLT